VLGTTQAISAEEAMILSGMRRAAFL